MNARLEAARERDEEAMKFLAHELKNRFIAIRNSIDNARLSVSEYSPQLLAPPYNVNEVFSNAISSSDRGVLLCMNRSVSLQLAHNTYRLNLITVNIFHLVDTINGFRCQVSFSRNIPETAQLDNNLVIHVLDNLISNAIKYGAKDGIVKLSVSMNMGQIIFEVINAPGNKHTTSYFKYGSQNVVSIIEETGKVK
jgi:signal transduction histidine kinase